LHSELNSQRAGKICTQTGATSIVVQLDFPDRRSTGGIVEHLTNWHNTHGDRIGCAHFRGGYDQAAHAAYHSGEPSVGEPVVGYRCAAYGRQRDARRVDRGHGVAEPVDRDRRRIGPLGTEQREAHDTRSEHSAAESDR
jgi:hypothetical protein